jgi:putative endonuclease
MRDVKIYYVYILASKTGVLYTGVTNNLKLRVFQHKTKLNEGFTQKYGVDTLMYFETFAEPHAAIKREKQIKAYRREKKVSLIDSINPEWADLSGNWGDKTDLQAFNT